jgi:hypothetical protein
VVLGKDEASILGGDDESDVLWKLLKICGFDVESYNDLVENNNFNPVYDDFPPLLPTRKDLNTQLLEPYSQLNVLLNQCKIGYLEFLILGTLILKTGAILSRELKTKILETAEWETDEWRWRELSEKFRIERKKNLKDFLIKIENHIDGQVSASESDFW